jgi:putative ABC transport system substrate-binding protein
MRRRELIALLGGAGLCWPTTANAAEKRVIGFVSVGPIANRAVAVRQSLSEAGFVEGHNLALEYRPVEGQYERLPAIMAELIGGKADVIIAGGPPAARAAKDATRTVPVVFVVGIDPVREGLVPSLAHPGGNLTGITILARDLAAKRLELVLELAPQAKHVALLTNPRNDAEDELVRDMRQATGAKGLQLDILRAGTEVEIDAVLTALAGIRPGTLMVGNDSFFNVRRNQIVDLVARAGVPAIYRSRDFADAGGLVSYGPEDAAIWHDVGLYAAKILKGTRPADLPVQQPTKFELVINLKTAKALGLSVPQSILARAEEVIE